MRKANRFTLTAAMVGLLNTYSVLHATVPGELMNKVVGARLDDLVNVNPKAVLGLANIVPLIKKYPEYFFKQGQVEVVHDVFFEKMPTENGEQVTLEVVAFVKYKNNSFTFEKMIISYVPGAVSTSQLYVLTEAVYPLQNMMFHASVGLIDRKLIIEDDMKGIKLIFPIGVGSFDEGAMNEGKTSLLTPRFQNGFIEQKEVISKRSKPRYFQGLPFIRISKGDARGTVVTPIGFHIEINDSFVRGFDSHGCMRLREMDLMAFHDLIVFGSQEQIPLTVQYKLGDLADSPIGKRNKSYKAILNKGTSSSPFFILDRDNLVQLTYKENSIPPVDKLVDNQQDDYEDLFSYETASQLKEQDARRSNECQAKVMSGQISSDPKSFQACVDEGKRVDSFKDRIYRKFMGIDDLPSSLP
jgi:hypothetical protein